MIRLTHREQWLVIGLIIFFTAWALFMFGIRPAVKRIETLDRVIPEKQAELEAIRVKSEQYLALRAGLDNLKRKAALGEKGFELLTFLESLSAELNMTKEVTTMKQEILKLDSNYREVVVEVKLENITLKQLIDFLLKTKASNHFLRLKSLYTQKNAANPNMLDTILQISALELNEAT